jgi:hypothetical protein
MTTTTTVQRLTIYRDRLKKARSFKEYRSIHLLWLETLIADAKVDEMKAKMIRRWEAVVQPEVKVKVKNADPDK